MEILRTPDDRFENLPDFDYQPHYMKHGDLRIHYIDEGEGDPILCLHGEPSWCYLYRKMIPILTEKHRVVAPDLIGFGRSDKPSEKEDYTYDLHFDCLKHFVEELDLKNVTLVCQDWGGVLGLPLATTLDDRFARLVIMNTGLPTGDKEPTKGFLAWREAAAKMDDMDVGRVIQGGTVSQLSDDVVAAYDAPFPDKRYKAGAHVFPLLVPIAPDDPAAAIIGESKEKLSQWNKPALVMFSDTDPVTKGGDIAFRKRIPSANDEPEITIEGGGHFLQEDKGEEIAKQILEFIERRPIS